MPLRASGAIRSSSTAAMGTAARLLVAPRPSLAPAHLLRHECPAFIPQRKSICLGTSSLVAPPSFHCAAFTTARRCVSTTTTTTTTSTGMTSSTAGSCSSSPQSSPSSSAIPVSPILLKAIESYILRHAPRTWMPVAELYADLSPPMRRQHVRPHKSLLHVLQKCQSELGLSIDPSCTLYSVGPGPPLINSVMPKPAAPRAPSAEAIASPSKKATKPANPAEAESPQAVLEQSSTPPVDFFFDVQLTKIPPPPPDMDVTPSTLSRTVTHSSADGSIISLRDFLAFIPPFFVPVETVLAGMPGYTVEHLEQYFSTATMELVTVGGQRLIRAHGGYLKLSLDGCEVAEEKFQSFRPEPALVEDFVRAFGGTEETWIPLTQLCQRVDPSVVARLPFQGTVAVAYFAQMQHRFAFAVRPASMTGRDTSGSSGGVREEAAVLLRRGVYTGLDCATTPTPKALHKVLHLVPVDGQVEVAEVAQRLPPSVQVEITAYYGSLEKFLAQHCSIFYVPRDPPGIVLRTRYWERMHMASLSLEEQLEAAVKARKKSKARTLRRRIATRDNPSHRLLDPDNLAKEVAQHLPRRGFVAMKTLLKQSIPEELLTFLPPKLINFLKAYPQYFTCFEHQQAGTWCVCRPDQPLPRGVLRQSFSDVDIVRLIAEYLQQRGPRSVSALTLNMPRGAQESVKKRHGGIYYFVTRYPQYFHVVLLGDNMNALTSAIVHLIQVPSRELEEQGEGPAQALLTPDGETHAIAEEVEEEDYDGLD